ncbi:MAG TPA: hypothetical protein DCZ94_20255 [Lentisphaeria bacterium]|nr:MAG: hypothetical protein A2X48_02510 [Lentisphaerae bacterium GWF2_49_21]HBC89280.1 hypothetical protein [Lentisphaeria bacterium]
MKGIDQVKDSDNCPAWIGIIQCRHEVPDDMIVRSMEDGGCKGSAKVFPEFSKRLDALSGFSHVHLVYAFQRILPSACNARSGGDNAQNIPTGQTQHRISRMASCIARIIKRKGETLELEEIDILDGAILIDIRPQLREKQL